MTSHMDHCMSLPLFHCMEWSSPRIQNRGLLSTAGGIIVYSTKKEAVCLHLLKDAGEMYTVNLSPL